VGQFACGAANLGPGSPLGTPFRRPEPAESRLRAELPAPQNPKLTHYPNPRKKKRPPKRVLALPGLEPRLAFNRGVVLRYRIFLEQKRYAATTIDLRLAAVGRVAFEAAVSGLLSP
jgi:hypothetical protein